MLRACVAIVVFSLMVKFGRLVDLSIVDFADYGVSVIVSFCVVFVSLLPHVWVVGFSLWI